MRTAGSRIVLVALVFVLALTLAACGGGLSEDNKQGDGGGANPSGTEEAKVRDSQATGEPMPASGAPGEAGGGQEMLVEDAGGSLPAGAGDAGARSGAAALPETLDRKIVKTAELGVEAESVRESAAEAQRIISRFGGTILSSELRGSDKSVSASLVLTVPSGEFEAALDELRGLGKKVTSDTVRGQDVTEEFVDLESRERNLLAAETSLLALYERAQTVEDTLTIQRELTTVRGEIELVQGRIKFLENRTTTSQISLSIQPIPGPPPRKPPDWSPAKVAGEAWEASLVVLRTAATAVISTVVFGWWLIPPIVVAAYWWRRHNRVPPPTTTGSSS